MNSDGIKIFYWFYYIIISFIYFYFIFLFLLGGGGGGGGGGGDHEKLPLHSMALSPIFCIFCSFVCMQSKFG